MAPTTWYAFGPRPGLLQAQARGLLLNPMTTPTDGATPLDPCGVGNFLRESYVVDNLVELQMRAGDLLIFRARPHASLA